VTRFFAETKFQLGGQTEVKGGGAKLGVEGPVAAPVP
jgi:hypothetical protein